MNSEQINDIDREEMSRLIKEGNTEMNSEQQRKEVLKHFTLADLDNEITAQSITSKLEQIDWLISYEGEARREVAIV